MVEHRSKLILLPQFHDVTGCENLKISRSGVDLFPNRGIAIVTVANSPPD